MATYSEAIQILRDARGVIERALDNAPSDHQRLGLRAHHDEISDEIRAIHQKRLEELTADYKPLTAAIGDAIKRLENEKQHIARLVGAAEKADAALAILAKAIGLFV